MVSLDTKIDKTNTVPWQKRLPRLLMMVRALKVFFFPVYFILYFLGYAVLYNAIFCLIFRDATKMFFGYIAHNDSMFYVKKVRKPARLSKYWDFLELPKWEDKK